MNRKRMIAALIGKSSIAITANTKNELIEGSYFFDARTVSTDSSC